MEFHVLTLFPEMIEQGLRSSIIGRAAENNIISLNTVNIRSYTQDKHGKVDDYPYGGGAGMLMQAQPVYDAHQAITKGRKVRTVYVTPQGRLFDQSMARELAREEELILLCGHYEGIDERVLEEVVTDNISIGDYVLTGGELAAMVIIDAVARLIPGVLGNETSAQEESFHNDLLEYPQYSRPEIWHGKQVPKVLLSGNHKEVEKWRRDQSEKLTTRVRPDLYERYSKKQIAIKHLAKDKRNNIHMMECLARGFGEIQFFQEDCLIIYHREGKICMLNIPEQYRQSKLLPYSLDFDEVELFITGQDFMKTLLEENGYRALFSCRQFLYTERVPLPVKHKDIRRLDMEYFDYICGHYHMDSPEYVKERIQAGVMYGAFIDGKPVGFIGMHCEGTLGMLYVEEAYRRRGIAESLESYAANRMLERGWTPFVHVIEGNEPSVRLQEKLGFYEAKNSFWWMEKGKKS